MILVSYAEVTARYHVSCCFANLFLLKGKKMNLWFRGPEIFCAAVAVKFWKTNPTPVRISCILVPVEGSCHLALTCAGDGWPTSRRKYIMEKYYMDRCILQSPYV